MKRFLHLIAAALACISVSVEAQTAINARQVTVEGVRLDTSLAQTNLTASLGGSSATFDQAKAATIPASVQRIMLADRDQSTWVKFNAATMPALGSDQQNYSWFSSADAQKWVLASEPITPEMFGAKCDYNFATKTGTVNTLPLQAMLNNARATSKLVQPRAGRKCLTGALYLNYDATYNPVGQSLRPGRIAIVGGGAGLATGALEDQGAAFVHINGEARPLLTLSGSFTLTGNDQTGGKLALDRFNLVGGSATTDVLYIKGSNGQMSLTDMTIKGVNKAGNGVTVSTTWEKTVSNLLLRGPALGLGPNDAGYDAGQLATGIGWNETDDGSGGQINMSVYTNLDAYKWGYGVRLGRSSAGTTGIYGPLTFIGGQVSLSDQVGFWVAGGVYNLTTIGFQIEQSRLNGLRIDSAGTTDLPRQIDWINGYFTFNGKVYDGTVDSYAVNVVDGVGVTLRHPLFQNTASGIAFNLTTALDFAIEYPEFRTVTSWGAASGTCIGGYGTAAAGARQSLVGMTVDNGCATIVDTLARSGFTQANRVSNSANTTVPSISLGSRTGAQSADILNLNYSTATTVTNIPGGRPGQTLIVTFSTLNATLQDNNVTLYLHGDFTPATTQGHIFLYYDGTRWSELSREVG